MVLHQKAKIVMTSPPSAFQLLRDLLTQAIASAQPAQQLPKYLPSPPKGRLVVIGAGKASAAMAQVLEAHWPGPLSGCVVTRYGYEQACSNIKILQASHPVPDEAGEQAAQEILATVANLTIDDTVICLISGGGSALLPLPLAGISLLDKKQITEQLLKSGATISEMNIVRRHLSAIKGGRLAAACYPAQLLTLLISDVPGDNPMDIASGPTVPDSTTVQDAIDLLLRYQVQVSDAVWQVLKSPLAESLKPQHIAFERSTCITIATPQMALQAAAQIVQQAGINAYILGDAIEGEAKEVAKVMAAMVHQIQHHQQPFQTPCVLLSGGETTVTVKGKGRGGRNVEFLLALAIALKGAKNVYALAADTDGVDGQEEIAGAVIGPDILEKAWQQQMNPLNYLLNNDAHTFFELLGASVITGPTLTNVNDFRAILIV